MASLITANALARGFADEMQEKILENTAHIAVSMKDGGGIFNWKEISENIKQNETVEAVSPTAYANSIVIGEKAVSYSTLIAKIQKPAVENRITISIGEKLAEKIGAKIGDEVVMVTLHNNTEPKRSNVFVENILTTGIYDYDSTWIYISPEDFASINELNNFTPTILSISVKDIYRTKETVEKIKTGLGEKFQIIDWQEANQPLFAALSLERKVSLVIISLIIFIAALNITTTLILLVNERKYDIAILRTCGAKGKILISIFFLEGLLIGMIGIIVGVSFGLLIVIVGNYFKLVRLTAEVYSISYIPFHIDFINVLLIVLTALFICFLATVYPAYRASRIKPLDNLRTG